MSHLCVCVFSVLSVCVCVCACAYHACWDMAALSAMSGTASSRVAAGENDDDEIKILRPAEGAAAISLAAVRIDLFQHLTFNHDKTVGKLIVLQDIRHQSPLILSGAPHRMNTNRLSRQPSHPLLPSLFRPSFFLPYPSSFLPLPLLFTNILFAFPTLIAYFCPKSFFLVSVGFISTLQKNDNKASVVLFLSLFTAR